jgi:hypothetical protein
MPFSRHSKMPSIASSVVSDQKAKRGCYECHKSALNMLPQDRAKNMNFGVFEGSKGEEVGEGR